MTEPGEIMTIVQWLAAVVVFVLGSAWVLVVVNVGRALWRRGRSYVIVQAVEADCGEYE